LDACPPYLPRGREVGLSKRGFAPLKLPRKGKGIFFCLTLTLTLSLIGRGSKKSLSISLFLRERFSPSL